MLGEGGLNRGRTLDTERYAVRHLETGLLARILHRAHEFARKTFVDQLVGQCRIERRQVSGIRFAGIAFC